MWAAGIGGHPPFSIWNRWHPHPHHFIWSDHLFINVVLLLQFRCSTELMFVCSCVIFSGLLINTFCVRFDLLTFYNVKITSSVVYCWWTQFRHHLLIQTLSYTDKKSFMKADFNSELFKISKKRIKYYWIFHTVNSAAVQLCETKPHCHYHITDLALCGVQ